VAEAHCVKCKANDCVSVNRGAAGCRFITLPRGKTRCVPIGTCSIPRASAQADLEPKPLLTVADAVGDGMGDPILRVTGACRPARSVISACSIANGQSSFGCKTPWGSGSRIRQGALAEGQLAAPTAGP